MEGRALWQLGRLRAHQGQHSDGNKLKREGMLLMETVLGPNHLDIAKCCTGDSRCLLLPSCGPKSQCLTARSGAGMARTCCLLHAYAEAEDHYGRAYGILSDSLGAEHLMVLDTMLEHAGVLIALSRFTHAEQVFRTVLDMR